MFWSGRSLVLIVRGLALTAALGLLVSVALSVWAVRRHDIKLLSVQSGSMEPAIQTGDAVVVRGVEKDELSVGDVISYRTAENSPITTHRVHSLSPTNKQIVTKGDANGSPDGVLDEVYLEGRAVAVAPYAGMLASLLQTPAGLIGLVYPPVTAVVIYEVIRLHQNLRKPYRLSR